MTDLWAIAGDLGQVAGAGAAAAAAWLAWRAAREANASSREAIASSREANAAAATMAQIEHGRRHGELCPRFEVAIERATTESLTLRVTLLGPPILNRVDTLTVTIRDDRPGRGEGPLLPAGPTVQEVKEHIWGPYRLTPGVGPDGVAPDRTGRATDYPKPLEVGESLPFPLQPTNPARWMTGTTHEAWRQQFGGVIRLSLHATNTEHGYSWTLPAQIKVGDATAPVSVVVPQ